MANCSHVMGAAHKPDSHRALGVGGVAAGSHDIPSAFASSFKEMGSFLGGSSWTGTLGSNLPVIFACFVADLGDTYLERRLWEKLKMIWDSGIGPRDRIINRHLQLAPRLLLPQPMLSQIIARVTRLGLHWSIHKETS